MMVVCMVEGMCRCACRHTTSAFCTVNWTRRAGGGQEVERRGLGTEVHTDEDEDGGEIEAELRAECKDEVVANLNRRVCASVQRRGADDPS